MTIISIIVYWVACMVMRVMPVVVPDPETLDLQDPGAGEVRDWQRRTLRKVEKLGVLVGLAGKVEVRLQGKMQILTRQIAEIAEIDIDLSSFTISTASRLIGQAQQRMTRLAADQLRLQKELDVWHAKVNTIQANIVQLVQTNVRASRHMDSIYDNGSVATTQVMLAEKLVQSVQSSPAQPSVKPTLLSRQRAAWAHRQASAQEFKEFKQATMGALEQQQSYEKKVAFVKGQQSKMEKEIAKENLRWFASTGQVSFQVKVMVNITIAIMTTAFAAFLLLVSPLNGRGLVGPWAILWSFYQISYPVALAGTVIGIAVGLYWVNALIAVLLRGKKWEMYVKWHGTWKAFWLLGLGGVNQWSLVPTVIDLGFGAQVALWVLSLVYHPIHPNVVLFQGNNATDGAVLLALAYLLRQALLIGGGSLPERKVAFLKAQLKILHVAHKRNKLRSLIELVVIIVALVTPFLGIGLYALGTAILLNPASWLMTTGQIQFVATYAGDGIGIAVATIATLIVWVKLRPWPKNRVEGVLLSFSVLVAAGVSLIGNSVNPFVGIQVVAWWGKGLTELEATALSNLYRQFAGTLAGVLATFIGVWIARRGDSST